MFLEIEQLRKSYGTGENKVEVLKGIQLGVEKGKICVLLGPSGSGKSTLLRILGTLDVPDEGTVKIGGADIYGGGTKLSDKQLSEFRRRNIGFVYQDYNLFPEYTAYENIVFPVHLDKRREDKDEVIEIMEKLGIEHCRDKFPFEMSGGEKQRVSLARALVNNPDVILADEPTGNLDTKSTQEIMEILKELHRSGRTVIIITHDEEIASQAHRVIRILDGRIEEDYCNR